MADDRPKVKSADDMDDETFLKHMNARHAGAAGLSRFGRTNVPNDDGERLLRAMHHALHHYPIYETNHDHGKAR